MSETDSLIDGRGANAWARLSRGLTPETNFDMHLKIYEQCYGPNALLRSPGPAWFPSREIIERANVTAVARELGLPDYPALHRWSVTHREAYWELVIRRLEIRLRRNYSTLLDATNPTQPRWLVGARMNIVDTCLQGEADAVAIIESDGSRPLKTFTYADLKRTTAKVANGLKAAGIVPGDTVAMIAPLTATSVATYLGVIAAGAAVVSIADSFAAEEIATRLRIAGAKLVFTQDVVHWGAKRLQLYDKVATATNIPIVVFTTEATTVRPQDRDWNDFISSDEQLDAVERDPNDAINILFSSGTTGEPKAIAWDHTTPIKCAADAHFHHDLHPGDVACWPTNLGWMMGPWLIFAALINHATMALYAQSPSERAFGQFVQDARVTMLGCVPSLVRAWRNSDCMRGLDWQNIRAFSSTGECSNAADMLYLMHLAYYRPIIEYCGGTEIGGAYITGTVVQPCIPATFSTAALGIDFAILNQSQPAPTGEVFLIGPSMGLSTRLLNRNHDAVYFTGTPQTPRGQPLRRHGDELESLPAGYYRVAGRSDDTMNLGGIKVSCAEIERALTTIPDIDETAAVAVSPPGGGPSRLVIFAVAKPGVQISPAELKPAMQKAIREQLNPLFHLDEVRIVDALPRTASNKVMRRELRAQVKQ